MSDKLTISSVQDFLKDYLANSETSILEEGKEKDDILEVATARGYNLQGNSDLAGFKTIFTFADKANKNRARLPKDKLLKALPGMIGKPVDIDHIRNFVVGHYIDYRYKASEDMVVAYGVFYKSNFGDEWNTAQKLFKSGKLGTSYEIWCPKNKRKYLHDGTYELQEMEIAGGGLMFKEKPAFEDAKVLELAKKHSEEHSDDLVIASIKKYDNEDIITSAATVEVPVTESAQPVIVDVKLVEKVVTPLEVKPAVPVTPVIPKIKCQNCNQEFDNTGIVATQSEKKCPNCKAIIGEQGEVKYPPQIIDFNMSCPSCHSNNWLLKSSTEDTVNTQCLSCKKEYNFAFEKTKDIKQLDKLMFVYIGSANCPQCNTYIPFSTVSTTDVKDLTCPSCKLAFNVNINKSKNKRKILKINELADLQKASAEGGNKEMDHNEVIQNQNQNVEVPPVVEVIIDKTPVVETPVIVEQPVMAATVEVLDVTSVETPVIVDVPVSEQIVTPIVEQAAVVKKTDEEIEKMEKDLSKEVKKGLKNKAYFKKAMLKLREMKKAAKLNKASVDELELAKLNIESLTLSNEDLKAKIQLLETSAVKIIERKNVLGEYGKDLSEKDILDDDKFEVAKVKKENSELRSKLETASTQVSIKSIYTASEDVIKARAKKIDDIAFPKK